MKLPFIKMEKTGRAGKQKASRNSSKRVKFEISNIHLSGGVKCDVRHLNLECRRAVQVGNII